MTLRKLWPLMLLASSPLLCTASVNPPGPSSLPIPSTLAARERQIWVSAAHDSKFAAMQHTSRPTCDATQLPQALATPNPLRGTKGSSPKVTVSFIIGADGHVYSPLILESAGSSQDLAVLNTVRSWRYRPATCNGIPTEAEGRIEFSSR